MFKFGKEDLILLTVLFVISFFLWTLPIQKSPIPFGEGDAAWHFSNGDYIYATDHTMGIKGLPNYISFWYYGFNKVLGPGALEYPPSNHVNYAIMQILGGERYVPVSIFKALTSFMGAFAVYFLLKRLYGTLVAFLGGFGLIFSLREYMIYLWGQQPSTLSFVILPITLYSFYAYFEKKKAVYLYLTSLLLAAQYLLHFQGFIASIIILAVFSFMVVVKEKEIVFLKDLKHLFLSFILFVLIAAPFFLIYAGASEGGIENFFKDTSRLFTWGVSPESVAGGFPDFYVLFSSQYRIWFVPFIILGIIFAAFRRKRSDLLMLSWFIGIYLILHLDVFVGLSSGRIARMLICEPQMLFSLTALGVVMIPNFFKMSKNFRVVSKYVLTGVFLLLITMSLGRQAYDYLNNAYPPIMRLTPSQLAVSNWMNKNLPENAIVFDHYQGTLSYPKIRWMLADSRRNVARYMNKENLEGAYKIFSDLNVSYYFMIDYSDLVALGQMDGVKALEGFELRNFAGKIPFYNQNNIKVYELEKNQSVE